jgi:hypothetical protein
VRRLVDVALSLLLPRNNVVVGPKNKTLILWNPCVHSIFLIPSLVCSATYFTNVPFSFTQFRGGLVARFLFRTIVDQDGKRSWSHALYWPPPGI